MTQRAERLCSERCQTFITLLLNTALRLSIYISHPYTSRFNYTITLLTFKLTYMSTIINNTEKTFTPSEQQAIHKAMADCGVDTVTTVKGASHTTTIFDFYDDKENYLFSIDTDADGDCVIWNKA